eukprot:scaffold203_cov386-Prasinococcus_capsulatus_cf.AAC.16
MTLQGCCHPSGRRRSRAPRSLASHKGGSRAGHALGPLRRPPTRVTSELRRASECLRGFVELAGSGRATKGARDWCAQDDGCAQLDA